VIGAIWGFIDGFLAGWFYAWLYNTARRVLMNRPPNQQATPEGGE
jgi:membrane associated rhomboid family serine protease